MRKKVMPVDNSLSRSSCPPLRMCLCEDVQPFHFPFREKILHNIFPLYLLYRAIICVCAHIYRRSVSSTNWQELSWVLLLIFSGVSWKYWEISRWKENSASKIISAFTIITTTTTCFLPFKCACLYVSSHMCVHKCCTGLIHTQSF